MKRLERPVQDLSFAIITHTYIWGTAEELFAFLSGKARELILIKHPFYESKANFSQAVVLKTGVVTTSILKPRLRRTLVDYMLDFLSSLFFLSRHGRVNVVVGADALNAMVGLVLRRLGLAGAVIYYAVDYTPRRFNNTVLNFLYHYFEGLCAADCDLTWNVTPRMIEARKMKLQRLGFRTGTQLSVRIPVRDSRVRQYNEIRRHGVIFSGSIREEAGLEMILSATQVIRKDIDDFELVISGVGSLKAELISQASEKHLESCVKFTDYIPSRREFLDFLSTFAVGLAVYRPSRDTYAGYADISKVKTYLACGLPVIICRESYNAKEIERFRAGVLVDFNEKEVLRALHELLDDKERYLQYRRNALDLAKEFNPEEIYIGALRPLGIWVGKLG